MIDPTRCLRQEHDLITTVLDRFETEIGRLHRAPTPPPDTLRPFVEFFRQYADRCHHQKEEAVLFPALEDRGLPRAGGPTGQMMAEHEAARAHLAAIERAIGQAERGELANLSTLVSEGEEYLSLLRAHIEKENEVLFMMAFDLLEGEAAEAVLQRFTEIDADPDYLRTRDRMQDLAARIVAQDP